MTQGEEMLAVNCRLSRRRSLFQQGAFLDRALVFPHYCLLLVKAAVGQWGARLLPVGMVGGLHKPSFHRQHQLLPSQKHLLQL